VAIPAPHGDAGLAERVCGERDHRTRAPTRRVSAGAIAMTRQRDRGSGRCAAILVERRAVGRPRRRSPRAKSRRGIREADEKLPVITGRSA